MSLDSLKLCDAIAEQSRCSICEGYLSCGPIRVLPDGTSICGHCSPTSPDILVYRDLVLEKVLSMISFPCRFRQHGCSERALFGQITDHESQCRYQIFACPAVSCTWKGLDQKLFDHIMKKHSELIKENAEIKLCVAQNTDGILMVVKGAITFIVKYLYDCNDNNLKYDIRYHAQHSKYDVSFKINLMNDSEPESGIYLKPKKCLVFDANFYNEQSATIMNVKKYYEVLDYPECIVVIFNLTLAQISTNIQVLDSLKCAKCCNYLIPPLFELGENILCCDCGKTDSSCTPSNNKELLQRVTEIKFPCRWRGCNFAGKSDTYKIHELTCKCYMHQCVFIKCDLSFTLADIVAHYQNHHNVEYLVDKIVCKFMFSQQYMNKHILAIKNDTVIVFEHAMINSGGCTTFKMIIFSTNPNIITGSVNFEHQHCTLKPKPFKVVSEQEVRVKLNQLPPCFKETDELTVTVTTE